jgi:anti-anti-sigma factor
LPAVDLRVYRPLPEVVIVRVSGTVDWCTAPALAQRVARQLTRAPHVVVDLGEVTTVDPRGLAQLAALHHQAHATGTQIHLARAHGHAMRQALQLTGLDHLFTLDPTVEKIIAEVRSQPPSPGRLDPRRPDQANLDKRAGKTASRGQRG